MFRAARSVLALLLLHAVLPGASAAQIAEPDAGGFEPPVLRLYGVIAGTSYASFTGSAFAPIVFDDSTSTYSVDLGAAVDPADGWGLSAGIEAGVTFDQHWRALGDIVLFVRQGSAVVAAPDVLVLLPGGPIVEHSMRTRTEIWLKTLDARFWAAFFVGPYRPASVTVAAGVAQGLYLESRVRRTYEADSPLTNPFGLPSENGGRTLLFTNDAIPEHADIELAALGRLTVEVPIGRYFLGVNVIGRLPLTRLSPALRAPSLELSLHFTRGEF